MENVKTYLHDISDYKPNKPDPLKKVKTIFLNKLTRTLRKRVRRGDVSLEDVIKRYKRAWKKFDFIKDQYNAYTDCLEYKHKTKYSKQEIKDKLKNCRKATRLLVISMCFPWTDDDIDIKCQITTFGLRFWYFLSQHREIPGERRVLAKLIESARENGGNFFDNGCLFEHCFGNLAYYCWTLDEEDFINILKEFKLQEN